MLLKNDKLDYIYLINFLYCRICGSVESFRSCRQLVPELSHPHTTSVRPGFSNTRQARNSRSTDYKSCKYKYSQSTNILAIVSIMRLFPVGNRLLVSIFCSSNVQIMCIYNLSLLIDSKFAFCWAYHRTRGVIIMISSKQSLPFSLPRGIVVYRNRMFN